MPTASIVSMPQTIDSPDMRHAGRDLLSLALMDARNHTLYLLAEYEQKLGAANFAVPQTQEFDPPLWLAGHIGWFAEFWIGRNVERGRGPACPSEPGRLASIEPQADRWWNPSLAPHEQRWRLDLPDVTAVRAYLLDTLESTLELLDKTPDDDAALYFFRLALFHEDMCGERFAVMAQTLGLDLKLAWAQGVRVREPLLIPATRWSLGSKGGGFCFDNEMAAHEVQVPEFEIDAQALTWAQLVEFVEDGGYDRSELWHQAGWEWLQQKVQSEGRRGPRHVEEIGAARQGSGGAVLQMRFGQAVRMAGNQTAMHLSWWEADAWARWAGRRLPNEVEWEVAAYTAARSGFRWGDVHEWTSGTFRPYPDFSPGPWSSYGADSFGMAKSLRGASFATRARMKHPKFRGFAMPGRDDGFFGLRTCAI
ncbi:MAG: SUMF1/EgtB/PvdO family nonheme iron enzyme [Burkholderiaceae bacterium]|nr:SUMF1/EgtB/PvdO family nonheme iron enzyme [Burkholderiaceae bacterium]